MFGPSRTSLELLYKILSSAPCIMCVQYRGGVQYHGGYHEYHVGYLEYCGGVQYCGDIMMHVRDIMSTMGCSVPSGYHPLKFEYRGWIS